MTDPEFTTEELNSEEWKPIPDFKRYEVSTLGRIRTIAASIRRPAKFLLKTRLSSRGYLTVTLIDDSSRARTVCPHKAVAHVFLEKGRNDQLQVNHKDGIKTNNRIENLEWVSPKENTQHSIKALGHSRSGEKSAVSKLTEQQVIKIHYLRMEAYTPEEIARMFNVSGSIVSRIIKRQSWKELLVSYPTNYPRTVVRSRRGSKHCRAKITEVIARKIKTALESDTSRGAHGRIARQFNTTIHIVKSIKYKTTWAYLT